MGIITRQIIRETITQLAIAVLTLTVVLSISMAAKEAVRLGMPPLLVLAALPYFILQMIGFALPAAVLYTVCSVFGRLAGDNELTALRSMGVSPLRVIEPVLVIAFLVSLAAVVSYDASATWARPGIKRLLAESAVDVAVGVLRTQRSVDMPWGTVSVRDVEGSLLVQPCIRLKESDNRPETQINAALGELQSDAHGMRLVLLDSDSEIGPDTILSHPGQFEVPLPGQNLDRPVHRDWLAMREVRWHAADLRERLVESERVLATAKNDQEREAAQAEVDGVRWKVCRLEAEPHRRWANGFSCIAFTLVGVPLAVMRGSASALSTFFVAFLPILLVFYPLLMSSESLALSGFFPVWSFWLADLVLAGAGLFLLQRALGR